MINITIGNDVKSTVVRLFVIRTDLKPQLLTVIDEVPYSPSDVNDRHYLDVNLGVHTIVCWVAFVA